jgi:hypothetical protein
MIFNQDASFDDIDMAYNIFSIKEVNDLREESKKLPFLGYVNGGSEPPKAGDYIINAKSENQFCGHISVISNVNLEEGYYDVVEQNYEKRFYVNNKCGRRLALIFNNKENTYHLTNRKVAAKYPKVLEHSDSEDSDEEGVIGWKRVERPLKHFGSKEDDEPIERVLEFKRKRRGNQVRPNRPAYEEELGSYQGVTAYSNCDF